MSEFADIPNLRHLRMVQVIGKVGGVTSASRELSTSQPAVTQAVANLEAEIGTPIFERFATGTVPTPLGKIYLVRIDRFFEILETAIEYAIGKPDNGAGRAIPRVDWILTNTQMRSLIVTSETGMVNDLAEKVGLAPASLFRSARALERALGRPLFDKTPQGPVPTKLGSYLAREFRRAIREIELARGEILLAEGRESLEITVGALPMAGSHELAKATNKFIAAYPSAKVRLVAGEYHKLLADLSHSRIDVIFGILRKPDWADDLQEELLFRDSYCLVARPDHPLAGKSNLRPEELARFEWVVPQPNTPRRNRIERIFENATVKPRFRLETPSLTISRAILLNSDAITLMTQSEIQAELDLGILTSLNCNFLKDVLPKGITSRADWLPTEAHAAFLESLRAVSAEFRAQVAASPVLEDA